MCITYKFSYIKEYIESFGYKLLSKEYVNNVTKLDMICPNGHKWSTTWAVFSRGNRCRYCHHNSRKLTYDFIKSEIEKIGYKLISEEYINSKTKLKMACPNNHKLEMDWNHFNSGNRCAICKIKESSNKRKLPINKIKEYMELEGYKLLSKSYINAHIKLKIQCPKDHIFEMIWNHFQQGQRCPECKKINATGESNYNWKGGPEVAWYDTYAERLNWFEEIRRDPDNKDLLQVRCTNSSCRKWFNPSRNQVSKRFNAAIGKYKRIADRFYCSEECKNECPLYRRIKYPKGFKNYNNRPNQKEWSDLVKERDNYTCQICGSKEDIVAHHYEGIYCNPLESADIDTGITLCKKCHLKVHSEEGCRFIDLMRKDKK